MKVRWRQAELARLAELRDQGTLTEKAYQSKKKQLEAWYALDATRTRPIFYAKLKFCRACGFKRENCSARVS